MSVVHLSHAATGGAGRAGRRAHLACGAAGIQSSFAFVQGEAPADAGETGAGEIRIGVAAGGIDPASESLARVLTERIQWDALVRQRTALSNSLVSIPYPGLNLDNHPLFATADIIHLHWPSWAVTPRQISHWLAAGRTVFWTLHDFWAMTGGCHYPAGCLQYRTFCMKCPQLFDDPGIVPGSFAEKERLWGSGGSLWLVTPSRWLAERARESAILGGRPVAAVPNPVELEVFRPPDERDALRAGFGIGADDLVLLIGGYDLKESRKGFAILTEALRELTASGGLASCLAAGARVHVGLLGKSAAAFEFPGCNTLNFGDIDDDEVMADVLGLADLICVPSLEDNYPNLILEGMSCGTPSLGFATGGIPEMVRDGETGLLEAEIGSAAALQAGLVRFATRHLGDLAMRARCRQAAETTNDPERIGKRLRELYENALGRPLRAASAAVHRRVGRALANAEMPQDARAGSDFLQFPVNWIVAGQGADRGFVAPPPPIRAAGAGEPVPRLITVRTRHEHHSSRSGPYQFIRHLPRSLYAMSHVTVPLGADLTGEAAALYQQAGLLLGTRAFGQQANNWLAETELAARCLAEPVDLVHFIDGDLAGWLLPGLPAELFHGGRRPHFVTTFHQPPEVLAGLINHRLLARFDGVVALCRSQADYLAEWVDPARLFVVPHGIDTSFFSPCPSAAATAPADDRFHMLLVGHWLRDTDSVFAALDLIEAAGVVPALTIVSPQPVNRGDPRVRVRTALSDEELRAEYWATDALILPLLDATANNAILEAMACGKPVISTRVGGVPETVGAGAAILCAPRDPEALARAALRLARRPAERAAMGEAARRRAEELDWRQAGQRQHEVYQAILGASRIP